MPLPTEAVRAAARGGLQASVRAKGATKPVARQVRIAQPSYSRSPSASPKPEAAGHPKPIKKCPNPECDGTETAEDGGQVICTECGAVVSDKQLTQDVQFGEAANGQAIVQGVHVGEGQETARPAPGSSRVMGGAASKDIAVSDARREMTRLAANPGWNIGQDDIDAAQRVFRLAYHYGHTKGRDRTHVCAVCLYIAVRQRPGSEGTLMLIDFADFINVSVFYLGRLYTELCEEIKINHEATVYQIRPELLAHRFCEELGFGSDTYRIATEAVSIIKRMNRDWLVRGRRPSGIVGAAVILAARMNNYRRTIRELVYTAKVCEYTITKRLDEFRCTPVSKLTVSQVRGKDWDAIAPEAVGPPALFPEAFNTSRKKRKRSRVLDETQDEVSAEDASASRSNMTSTQIYSAQANADRLAMPPPSAGKSNINSDLLQASALALQDIGDNENAERLRRGKGKNAIHDDDDADVEDDAANSGRHPKRKKRQPRPLPVPSDETLADEQRLEEDINANLLNEDMLAQTGPAHEDADKAPPQVEDGLGENQARLGASQQPYDNDNEEEVLEQYFGIFHHVRPEYDEDDDDNVSQQQLPTDSEWTSLNHQDIQDKYKETMKHTRELIAKYPVTSASLLDKVSSSEMIPDDEFADDPDVNDMILDDEEVKVKEAFWISRYGKHLKERHLKKVQKLIDEEHGNIKQPRKRGTKKPRPGDDSGYARDQNGKVGEGWVGALKATFEHRGSNKLNYQAIGKILDSGPPSAGVSNVVSRAGSEQPSVAGSVASRQSTPGWATKPMRMPKLPKTSRVSLSETKSVTVPANTTSRSENHQQAEQEQEAAAKAKVEQANQHNAEEDDDYYDDDDDNEEDDGYTDMANVSEEVRNRMAAGMTYEEALAANNYGGF